LIIRIEGARRVTIIADEAKTILKLVRAAEFRWADGRAAVGCTGQGIIAFLFGSDLA